MDSWTDKQRQTDIDQRNKKSWLSRLQTIVPYLGRGFVDVVDGDDVGMATESKENFDFVLRISFRFADDFDGEFPARLPVDASPTHRIRSHLRRVDGGV